MSKLFLSSAGTVAMSLFFVGCMHGATANKPLDIVKASDWKEQNFVPHQDMLAINVDPQPVQALATQIQTREDVQLKNTGESHIAIISSAEFSNLNSFLTMADINTLADTSALQKIKWTPVCVGRGSDRTNHEQKTYFLIVKAPALYKIREKIFAAVKERGVGKSFFDPDAYTPFITIGYTERDLDKLDGVTKDKNACVYDVKSP